MRSDCLEKAQRDVFAAECERLRSHLFGVTRGRRAGLELSLADAKRFLAAVYSEVFNQLGSAVCEEILVGHYRKKQR